MLRMVDGMNPRAARNDQDFLVFLARGLVRPAARFMMLTVAMETPNSLATDPAVSPALSFSSALARCSAVSTTRVRRPFLPLRAYFTLYALRSSWSDSSSVTLQTLRSLRSRRSLDTLCSSISF